MSNEAKQSITSLTEEINQRRELTETFNKFLGAFEDRLHAATEKDLDAIAGLFYSLREQRKSIEKQEETLKEELKRYFGEARNVLYCGDYIVIKESRERTDLDKAAMVKECGTDFIARFLKKTEFDVLSVKRVVK